MCHNYFIPSCLTFLDVNQFLVQFLNMPTEDLNNLFLERSILNTNFSTAISALHAGTNDALKREKAFKLKI